MKGMCCFFFRNSHVMCRLLCLVLAVQQAVKAGVERESPGAVLGNRLRLPGPQSEDGASGVLQARH